MSKAMRTKDRLLLHARRQFWSVGYSNVSVRQIASAASVDVALISRHFGSKLGLFKATLEDAFEIFETPPTNEQELVDEFTHLFTEAPRDSTEPSAILMLLTNSHDEEVGELVRNLYDEQFQQGLRTLLGAERAALFASVLFGFSVVEKSLQVDGIAAPTSEAFKDQLRHLMQAALNYPSK
ncbi:MAG: TetR/AcrR family transcriptional regulator [Pseudomonadota bacterium]